MKVSNQLLINSASGLNVLSQEKLPVKTSYALAKNLEKVEHELKVFNAEKQKLVQLYAEKDESGKVIEKNNRVTFKGPNLISWNKDYDTLLNIENEIDIRTILLDDLECINLSAIDIISIGFMILENNIEKGVVIND